MLTETNLINRKFENKYVSVLPKLFDSQVINGMCRTESMAYIRILKYLKTKEKVT